MFTFIVQAIDLFTWGYVQLFFTFFLLTWSVYLFKFIRSRGFRPLPQSGTITEFR